jgi:peroxiredoxin
MALTQSSQLALQTLAPSFSLESTEGDVVSLTDFDDAPALLVIFLCNHCPYVIHVADAIAALARDLTAQEIAVVGINSNDTDAYPADSLPRMAEEKTKRGYVFSYLLDKTQDVARAFQAACTPEFYLFDERRALVYRGQLDASRPGNGIQPSGDDIRRAVEALKNGQPPLSKQDPSVGCNIKWRPGKALA